MPGNYSLFAAAYSANALSVATALASLSILLLGLIVIARGHAFAASRLFLVTTLAAGLWVGSSAAMYASVEAPVALAWARIGALFAALLPAALYHLAATLTGRWKRYRSRVGAIWVVSAGIALTGLFTGRLIVDVKRHDWGFYPVGRPVVDSLIVGVSAIGVIAAIQLFWKTYRNAEGRSRERSGALLLAVMIGSLTIFDYLPAVGIPLQPIGYVAVFAFVVIASTAVWRFELDDITAGYAAGQILETMKSAVLVSDMSGCIRIANHGAERLLGYRAATLRKLHLRDVLDTGDSSTTGQLLNSMGVVEHPMSWRTATGSRVDVLATSSLVRDEDGMPVGVVYVASDYTDRKRAEEALRESEKRYRALFELNPLPMWVYNAETLRFTAVNDAAVRHYGYSRSEFMQMTIRDIRPPEEIPTMLRALDGIAERRGPVHHRHQKKDGAIIDVEISSFEFLSGRGRARLVIAQDITERKQVQEQLEYQAYHDSLTSLPNRLLFRDRITIALAHARRNAAASAVMFLDLDQFKVVNDTLGHTIGDALLQEVGQRLVECVRSEDTVARMGGDEFTILLADLSDGSGAVAVAEKILEVVRQPVIVDGHALRVTTSVGIALFPTDGEDAESLLRQADRAMYRAKELGRNNYQFAGAPPRPAQTERLTVRAPNVPRAAG